MPSASRVATDATVHPSNTAGLHAGLHADLHGCSSGTLKPPRTSGLEIARFARWLLQLGAQDATWGGEQPCLAVPSGTGGSSSSGLRQESRLQVFAEEDSRPFRNGGAEAFEAP